MSARLLRACFGGTVAVAESLAYAGFAGMAASGPHLLAVVAAVGVDHDVFEIRHIAVGADDVSHVVKILALGGLALGYADRIDALTLGHGGSHLCLAGFVSVLAEGLQLCQLCVGEVEAVESGTAAGGRRRASVVVLGESGDVCH